jgi:hypothetical protein
VIVEGVNRHADVLIRHREDAGRSSKGAIARNSGNGNWQRALAGRPDRCLPRDIEQVIDMSPRGHQTLVQNRHFVRDGLHLES